MQVNNIQTQMDNDGTGYLIKKWLFVSFLFGIIQLRKSNVGTWHGDGELCTWFDKLEFCFLFFHFIKKLNTLMLVHQA